MLTELLELIADTAEKNCSLGTEISLEELPADGGIYAELGEGSQDDPGIIPVPACRSETLPGTTV